jgi:hypothetical protein
MAARKSCTHLTWAEAKGKTGNISSSGGNKNNARRENHGKLLANKIISKAGPSETEVVKNRQAARLARRDQQRQEQLETQRQAQKERQRMEAVAEPHQQALEKLEERAVAYQSSTTAFKSYIDDAASAAVSNNSEDLSMILLCESKQLQVDELLALQAIFADTPDILVVADDCRLEELQQNLEDWQMDASSSNHLELSAIIASHPPLRIVLKRSVDDPKDDDWVAHCLLEIVFPHDYPIQVTPPQIRVEWFLLTQKSLVVAENKPLESLGTLDESGIVEALKQQAQELGVGMPCLYEILDTWWCENVFEFISLNPILP